MTPPWPSARVASRKAQGSIAGPHANGYAIAPNGKLTDTTDWHFGKGAEGAIVSNAQDTAAFLTGLMQGKLLEYNELATMVRDNIAGFGAENSGCAGTVYGGTSAGDGYKANAWVNGNGTRVVVLLLKGFPRWGARGSVP